MRAPRGGGSALTGLVVLGLVFALVVAHLLAFRIVSSRMGLSMAAAGVVLLAAVATHLGLLGSVGAWLRRRYHGEPK